LLVQEVAAHFPNRVTFVTENFGASKLAERFGVKGYPAVFIDDVLVASPREFGYFGEKDGTGRYAPWRDAGNQAKFKADLTRMIGLVLEGKKDVVSRENAANSTALSTTPPEIASLPALSLKDLSGKAIPSDEFSGRVVLVEFWATWCPPCRSTLAWLGELQQKYGDRLSVLALAVESPEGQVRETAASVGGGLHWAIADAPTAQAFGDITAVPTMFLFDRTGKLVRVQYGAPPDLHRQVGQTLDEVIVRQ
jgi:thiol-disulfide isomerase/thioredoxin